MNAIALWVAGLPGAVGRIPAFEVGALVVATAGLCLICLLRTRLRFVGAVLVVIAILMAARGQRSDVLVTANADAVAVRGADGRLSILRNSSDPLALREWLTADGDARQPHDPTLKAGFSCDDAACLARLPDGTAISVARTAHGVAEDCRDADLVVTTREAPANCRAPVIDRRTLREGGALALQRIEGGWKIERAVPSGTERPWAHARGGAASFISTDAMPRSDDLEPGD
jgi:competence protein ComEC